VLRLSAILFLLESARSETWDLEIDAAWSKRVGHVDLLLIPTGGPGATLELDEALALWEKLRPSVIIPMHSFSQSAMQLPQIQCLGLGEAQTRSGSVR